MLPSLVGYDFVTLDPFDLGKGLMEKPLIFNPTPVRQTGRKSAYVSIGGRTHSVTAPGFDGFTSSVPGRRIKFTLFGSEAELQAKRYSETIKLVRSDSKLQDSTSRAAPSLASVRAPGELRLFGWMGHSQPSFEIQLVTNRNRSEIREKYRQSIPPEHSPPVPTEGVRARLLDVLVKPTQQKADNFVAYYGTHFPWKITYGQNKRGVMSFSLEALMAFEGIGGSGRELNYKTLLRPKIGVRSVTDPIDAVQDVPSFQLSGNDRTRLHSLIKSGDVKRFVRVAGGEGCDHRRSTVRNYPLCTWRSPPPHQAGTAGSPGTDVPIDMELMPISELLSAEFLPEVQNYHRRQVGRAKVFLIEAVNRRIPKSAQNPLYGISAKVQHFVVWPAGLSRIEPKRDVKYNFYGNITMIMDRMNYGGGPDRALVRAGVGNKILYDEGDIKSMTIFAANDEEAVRNVTYSYDIVRRFHVIMREGMDPSTYCYQIAGALFDYRPTILRKDEPIWVFNPTSSRGCLGGTTKLELGGLDNGSVNLTVEVRKMRLEGNPEACVD